MTRFILFLLLLFFGISMSSCRKVDMKDIAPQAKNVTKSAPVSVVSLHLDKTDITTGDEVTISVTANSINPIKSIKITDMLTESGFLVNVKDSLIMGLKQVKYTYPYEIGAIGDHKIKITVTDSKNQVFSSVQFLSVKDLDIIIWDRIPRWL